MDLRQQWRIVNSAGTDLTDRLRPYLQRIAITDNPGHDSDSATLTLHRALDFPKVAQALTLYLGDPLVKCGTYYVDEFTESEDPLELEVVCRAVHFGGDLTEDEAGGKAFILDAINQSYESVTLADVGAIVAQRLNVVLAMDPDFGGYAYDYLEQTGETDAAFITRVAGEAGAIAKITSEALTIGTTHTRQSLRQGRDLPNVTIARADVVAGSASVTWSVRSVPGAVSAVWHVPKSGEFGEVTAGTGRPLQQLGRVFPSEAQAQQAAQKKLQEAQRRRKRLTCSLHQADTRIWVGSSITFKAPEWRSQFLGSWSVLRAGHTNSTNGSGTQITAELEQDG